jgi:uncharacterized protein (DUF58 family)
MVSIQSRFLDPKALKRLNNLNLLARTVVEGFISGLHRSPFKGFSVEFAEYRQYVPGDDLKHFDWKVYARNDRRYIRQYQEETNLKAYIAIDASGSMDYGSDGMTKFDYACSLAACLCHLLVRQKDAAGLVAFSDEVTHFLPPRATRGALLNMVGVLDRLKPGRPTRVGKALHEIAERIKRRALVVVLSDLLEDPAEILNALKHLRHQRHEVLLFQILDPVELDFPFRQLADFRDLETGEKIQVHPGMFREAYLKEVEAMQETFRRACSESRIDYQVARTDVPFDVFLARYLSKRARLG